MRQAPKSKIRRYFEARVVPRLSLRLSRRFIRTVAQHRTGFGYKFGASSFDEVACLGDDFFQILRQRPQAGFPVNEFGDALLQGRIGLDLTGGAERAGAGSMLRCGCHTADAAPVRG
ncbi:MAG: hypothetical protein DMG57_38775 [Acidobacteria bacterium]|nr:MAG: hypothetical protein DMG57_38775 [Acidobacteriota bacterium]